MILNEQQEQQPKTAKYNSLFYFLEIRSSKFLPPTVQDLYVFVHQIEYSPFFSLFCRASPTSFPGLLPWERGWRSTAQWKLTIIFPVNHYIIR